MYPDSGCCRLYLGKRRFVLRLVKKVLLNPSGGLLTVLALILAQAPGLLT